MLGSDVRLITFTDGEYKPAAGEILAKDSILYSQKPETRLLRRQLWPIMQETMDTLVDSVNAGADLFKNILKPSSNPIAAKIRNIKNAYISSSTVPHLKITKYPATTTKKVKKVKKIVEPTKFKTVSDDYVHTYNEETYTVPSYVTKSAPKNPYAQMGMKDYKHFEETVLRELEEKEERKVEAAMGSVHKKKTKSTEVQETPFEDWQPMKPNHLAFGSTHQLYDRPKEVGKLHTNIMASDYKGNIHEVVAESRPQYQVTESVIEQPTTNSASKSRKRKQNRNRSTITTTTVSPAEPFTRASSKEIPNYPEHFLKKQNDVDKENGNVQDVSQEINYLKRMKFYREQMQGFTTSATFTSSASRPPNARDPLVMEASEEKFVFITPTPKLFEDRKVKRQKLKMTGGATSSERTNIRNRGSIKFSDSV